MAFGFFKDKSKGPLEVSCPLCHNTQQESRLAVSSYCKKCGAYLTFDGEGGVKARPVNPPDPFADRPPQDEVVVDYSPRVRPEESSSPASPNPPAANKETEGEGTEKEETTEPQPPSTPSPQPSSDSPPPSRFHGTPKPAGSGTREKIETRDVTCFECGATHPANVHANSTQCRECGRLIPMQDREIRETWSSPIQTRGNVHIHKKGFVRSAPIECHNLVIEGEFSGDARCSGDLVIRRNGKISGQISCHRLLVERRAKVEFLGPVEMEEGRIDGLVNGNLSCRGLLALQKKAVLTGNLKVGSLTIADGAKHNGQVRMGAF